MIIKCFRCGKHEHRHDRSATVVKGICSKCREKRLSNPLAAIYYGQRPRDGTGRRKRLKISRQ